MTLITCFGVNGGRGGKLRVDPSMIPEQGLCASERSGRKLDISITQWVGKSLMSERLSFEQLTFIKVLGQAHQAQSNRHLLTTS